MYTITPKPVLLFSEASPCTPNTYGYVAHRVGKALHDYIDSDPSHPNSVPLDVAVSIVLKVAPSDLHQATSIDLLLMLSCVGYLTDLTADEREGVIANVL